MTRETALVSGGSLITLAVIALAFVTRDIRARRRQHRAEQQMFGALSEVIAEETARFEQAVAEACALTSPEPQRPTVRPAVPRAVGRARVRRSDRFAQIVNNERQVDRDLDELLRHIEDLYLIGGDPR